MMIAIAGCGAGRQEWNTSATLTRDAPRAVFAPPGGFGNRSDLAIVAVENPSRSRFTIRISDGVSGKVLQHLALYPQDEPGSFALVLPHQTERIAVDLQSRDGSLPSRIVVHLSTRDRP